MAAKKKVTKRKPRSSSLKVEVKNVDKVVKAAKESKCGSEKKGCGGFWMFGSALAMVLSYGKNVSILWAIIHGVFSWFYVLFRAMQVWGWF